MLKLAAQDATADFTVVAQEVRVIARDVERTHPVRAAKTDERAVQVAMLPIKSTMQMDVLRCKTPEVVRKEIWTHTLAYNLIRMIMAQAATMHGVEPRTISFKGGAASAGSVSTAD